MVKRSIIKHGPSTLIVSLPSKWAKERGIKAGSEVDVQPQGNNLIIMTDEGITKPELSLDVSGLTPHMITRLLARSYQKGYDVVHLTFSDRKSLHAIREKVSELIGFDIVEEDKHRCTIQAIANTLTLDFDTALRRAFFRVAENVRTCRAGFVSNDKDALEGVWESDLEVNKMTYFCLRTLSKGMVSGYEAFVVYHLIETLEDLGDEIKYLALNLIKISKNRRWVAKKLDLMTKLCELSFKYYYKPKQEDAVKVFDLVSGLSSSDDLPENANKEIVLAFAHFSSIADCFYLFVGMKLDMLSEVRPAQRDMA